ncbi:hypothetical protein ACTXT7_008078 [Hymenolepis weldensis]
MSTAIWEKFIYKLSESKNPPIRSSTKQPSLYLQWDFPESKESSSSTYKAQKTRSKSDILDIFWRIQQFFLTAMAIYLKGERKQLSTKEGLQVYT